MASSTQLENESTIRGLTGADGKKFLVFMEHLMFIRITSSLQCTSHNKIHCSIVTIIWSGNYYNCVRAASTGMSSRYLVQDEFEERSFVYERIPDTGSVICPGTGQTNGSLFPVSAVERRHMVRRRESLLLLDQSPTGEPGTNHK